MPSFPANGGIASLPGFPDYQAFVDPSGSNGASGTASSPFLTIYRAVQDVIDHGGGTVRVNNNCRVGGPVDGQGIWLCGPYHPAVPGFINVGFKSLRIVGNGNQSNQFVFEAAGAAKFITNSVNQYDNYGRPGIWVVGCEQPMEFAWLKSSVASFDGLYAPTRFGWDWARRPDFSKEEITATNASRNGSTQRTVFTVDLSTATAWDVVSATRATVDGVKYVTLTLTRPLTVAMSPWVPGSYIRVAGIQADDPDFPDGDYVVTNQSDILNLQGETQITVTYQQNGTNKTSAVTGTVRSHGCAVGDYIQTAFLNAEFVTCPQMRVTSVSIDTVTVFDPYGYGSRTPTVSGNPLGTIVKQIRGRQISSGVVLNQCSIFGKVSTQTFFADELLASPTFDLGGTSANVLRMYRTYFSGGNAWDWSSHPSNYDPSRTLKAVLADPGANTASGASFQANDCQSQSGNIEWNPQGTEAAIDIDQWLQDSSGNALPTVVCGQGTTFASVRLDRIGNADAATQAVVIGAGYDPLKVEIGDVYSSNATPVQNSSLVIGPRNMRSAFWNSSGAPTASPWHLGWRTTWVGGLSTPHVGPNRTFGVVQSRFANIMPAFGSWVGGSGQPATLPTGVTATTVSLAPDGSSTAIKLTLDNTYDGTFIVVGKYPETAAWSVGDYVAVGCWINSPDSSNVSGLVLNTYTEGDISFGGITVENSGVLYAKRNILTAGWQWCVAYGQVSAITTGHYYIRFALPVVPGDYLFYAPTIARAPVTAGINDISEWAGTLKHQPVYLPVGMAGTMENVKLIGHGGLGCKSSLVTVTAPGTADRLLTIFDQDGNALIKVHGEAP